MTILADEDRFDIWADFMRSNAEPLGDITKGSLRATVDAIDAFFHGNEETIEAAIDQPAWVALSTTQRGRLLIQVIQRRIDRGL